LAVFNSITAAGQSDAAQQIGLFLVPPGGLSLNEFHGLGTPPAILLQGWMRDNDGAMQIDVPTGSDAPRTYEPLLVIIDFDAAVVDQIIERLQELRVHMLPALSQLATRH
jgi:hypothetical protein